MKYIVPALLMTFASASFAGPTAIKSAGSFTGDDGRNYMKLEVKCAGRKEMREIISFEGNKQWCLVDESFCNKSKIRTAKKVCQEK